MKNESKITLYPNPAKNYASVLGGAKMKAEVSLKGMAGKQLLYLAFCGNEPRIELGKFNDGFYIVNVKQSGINDYLKLLKRSVLKNY